MRFAALAAGLAVLASASAARADVDVEVPATFKSKGTLTGDNEDVYRFQGTEGAVLDLKVSAPKSAAIDIAVELRSPTDAIVLPVKNIDGDTKVQWKDAVLPESGEYTLRIGGEGAGDYSLAVTTKAKTAFGDTLFLGPIDTNSLSFGAPRGSIVSFRVFPDPESTVVPELITIVVAGDEFPLTQTVKGTVRTATFGPTEAGGDCNVVVFNNNDSSGIAVLSIKVKPPKVKPGKFDVRAGALGMPAGGQTLVGRVLDVSGGSVAVEDEGSVLFGAGVNMPAGALDAPTLVSVATAPEPVMETDVDQAAGPAVRLEPSGTTFDSAVQVTLPIDFTKLPAFASTEDIRILIVEDNGDSAIVDPSTVGANTVTVDTNGFSICIPIIQSGPPNFGYSSLGALKPGGDEFWMLQVSAELITGGGTDSRNRSLGTSLGQFAIHAEGTVDFNLATHSYGWSNQSNPPMSGTPIQAGIAEEVSPEGGTLDWAYDSTRTKIALSGSPNVEPTFRVSRDGRYMVGVKEGQTEGYMDVQYAVRKNARPLTAASVKGTWAASFLEFEGTQNNLTSGAAGPRLTRAQGTFVFDGVGKVDIALTQRTNEFNESNGSHSQFTESFGVKDATYAVEEDGTILVTVPPADDEETGTTLRILPGDGLQVMLCSHDTPLGDAAMAMILVRQGSGLSRTGITGRFHGVNFALDPGFYNPGSPSVNIPDFSINTEALVGTLDGSAAVTLANGRYHAQRDNMIAGGVRVENDTEDFTVSVNVASNGKSSLAADGKVTGQVTPDGEAFAFVSDVAGGDSDFGLFFFFRSPPVYVP